MSIGFDALHAAFLHESRTRGPLLARVQEIGYAGASSAAWQEIQISSSISPVTVVLMARRPLKEMFSRQCCRRRGPVVFDRKHLECSCLRLPYSLAPAPPGLTAALEFLRRSDVHPIVIEASHEIGGISRTIRHNGNRIDIGGHRFFSKSDRVMNWWMELMPPEASADTQHALRHQNKQRTLKVNSQGLSPETTDLVMLVRPRKSRIYFLRRFFDYPIKLTADTLRKLGLVRTVKIGFSYLMARLFPRKVEKSLEDFLINRFGRQLYLTFFKSYTEKVWGVPCRQSAPSGEHSASRGCRSPPPFSIFLRRPSLLIRTRRSSRKEPRPR